MERSQLMHSCKRVQLVWIAVRYKVRKNGAIWHIPRMVVLKSVGADTVHFIDETINDLNFSFCYKTRKQCKSRCEQLEGIYTMTK